jgi:multidrug efflux pump subunit AcrA (membrane-fusion protein)
MKSIYFTLLPLVVIISPISAAEVRIKAVAPEPVVLNGPFELPGRVVPGERTGQGMPVSGRIKRMLVSAGMRIGSGTPIAEIETPEGRSFRIVARHSALVSRVRSDGSMLEAGEWLFLEREEGTFMVVCSIPEGIENEFRSGVPVSIVLPTVQPTEIASRIAAVHDGAAYSAISYSSRFLEYRTVTVRLALRNNRFLSVPVSSVISPTGGDTFIWTVSPDGQEPRRIAVQTFGFQNGKILLRGAIGPREYIVVTPLHLLGRQKEYQWTILEKRGGMQ